MKPIDLRIAEAPNHLDRAMPPPGDAISLRQMLRILRRHRRVLAVAMGLWLVLGLAYLVTTPRIYAASSLVLLDAGVNRAVERIGAIDEDNLTEAALENARLVIRSDAIAQAVAGRLALADDPAFARPPVSGLARLVGGAVGLVRGAVNLLRGADLPAQPADPAAIGAARDRLAARMLQQSIGVDRVGRSAVVAITYQAHDPVLAANVANAVAEAYIADVLNANFEATEHATAWMQGRLTRLEAESQAAAAAAEAFRARHGLVASRGVSMSDDSIVQLNARMAEAVAEVARTRARADTYRALTASGPEALVQGGAIGLGGVEEPALTPLQQDLAEAQATLARVERAFGPDHAQVTRLRAQVQLAAERLFAQLRQQAGRAQGELAIAEARVAALTDSLGAAIDTKSASGAAEVELQALQQRAETLATLYQAFLTKFQEIEQQKSFPISNVRILTMAEVPRAAAGPSSRRVLLAALVLGAVCGLVAMALAEWRDRFLRTAEDVADDTGAAFLGYLPRVDEMGATPSPPVPAPSPSLAPGISLLPFRRGGQGDPAHAPVAGGAMAAVPHVLRFPRSFFAETLRNARLAADIAAGGQGPVVIGVAAARPGEGKTTVAMNLAAVIGLSGARVLLMDCDLRRPGLSRHLGLVQGAGLVEAVLGRQPWRSVLVPLPGTAVQVLPCIPPPGLTHTADLLSSRGMRQLLSEARAEFDYVIVDMSPLGAVVDARVLVPQVDGMVLVAAWGETPKSMLKRMILAEPALRGRLLGTLLNKVDMVALRGFVDADTAEACLEEYGDYFADPAAAPKAADADAGGRGRRQS